MSLNCNPMICNYGAKTTLPIRQAQLYSTHQNINGANLQQDTFQKIQPSIYIMDESVIKKNGTIFNNFATRYSGSLNNKNINLTSKSDGLTIFANTNVQGVIADKPIEFTFNNKTFIGNYNGVEFDLKFQKNDLLDFFASKKIVGTIDGKEIELDLKNSKIPEDENTRDIITTFLMIRGLAPKVKNGQFNGTRLAEWNAKEQNEAAAAMIMSSPNAMYNSNTVTYNPTWHYENPMAPIYY